MKAFHAYPSKPQVFYPNVRIVPMACDIVEFDETGWYDPIRFGFVPQKDCTVFFNGNVLWQNTPILTGKLCAWLFHNGIEVAGSDGAWAVANTGPSSSYPISRILQLKAGDIVTLNPGNLLTAPFGLTPANIPSYRNTSNFFEGFVLSEKD